MSSDENIPKFSKLTGPLNYRIWAEEVGSFLESKGLLDLVLGDEPRPDNTHASSSRRTAGTRARAGIRSPQGSADAEDDTGVPGLSLYEAWRRRNASARTWIMRYCSTTIKHKIIHLRSASEQWEALRKDSRPLNDVLLSTYTS